MSSLRERCDNTKKIIVQDSQLRFIQHFIQLLLSKIQSYQKSLFVHISFSASSIARTIYIDIRARWTVVGLLEARHTSKDASAVHDTISERTAGSTHIVYVVFALAGTIELQNSQHTPACRCLLGPKALHKWDVTEQSFTVIPELLSSEWF
mmetsp:Transcript_7072/g.12698  ORF Transcript_7072/g.12698 Transcript_7072/m.12698 type:complete len:151 (-) Transcript_7072:771-1223(-)